MGGAAMEDEASLFAWIDEQVREHYADGHKHIRSQVPGSTSWWYVCPYDLMLYPFVPLHVRRFEQHP